MEINNSHNNFTILFDADLFKTATIIILIKDGKKIYLLTFKILRRK